MKRGLTCLAVFLAAAVPATAQPPAGPEPIQLTLSPAAAPSPALKYELLPELKDQTPGNAALEYYRAFSPEWWGHIQQPKTQELLTSALQMPLKDLPRKDLNWVLNNHMLQQVDLAARREYCNWGMAERLRREGIGLLLPDVQSLRQIAALLAVRARLEIADGHYDKALYTLQTGFSLGRASGNGVILVQDLVGMAVTSLMIDRLVELVQQPGAPNLYWALTDLPEPFFDLRTAFQGEKLWLFVSLPEMRILETARLTPEQLRNLTNAYTLIVDGRKASEAERLEVALVVLRAYPEAKRALIAAGRKPAEVEALPAMQVVLIHSLHQYQRLQDDLFKWYGLPYWEARPHYEQVERQVRQARARLEGMPFIDALPAIQKVTAAPVRLERRVAALRIVEAIRLHAAAHDGKLPAALGDVTEVPIPIDPMTGKAFTYQASGDRATLSAPPPAGEQANPSNTLAYELTLRAGLEMAPRKRGLPMYRFPAMALVLALALPVAAAEKFDAEARARAVAPFLDAQTVGVAHVDLTRIDADALFDWAVQAGHLDAKELEGTRRDFRAWLAGLTRAGAKELYAVGSLADVPNEPLVLVVPLADGADAKAVSRDLGRVKAFAPFHFETRDQAVVGGSEAALKRLRAGKPAARPDLARAFAAAGDTAAQVLVLPPPDAARIFDELLPKLPPQLGGGSTRPLTHGLVWAALGVDPPPKLSVRLTIQSPDADSARALKDVLARLVKSLSEQRAVRDFLPGIDRLAEVFTPQVEGDRLTLSLGDEELKAFLPTLVRRTYQAAERGAAMNHLRQMVIAMHNYADTYRGRGPAHFPAVATFNKQGKPLLSWRVSLLPFVGANELYKQFHLDEPWDSPHNRQLIARMPEVYQGPNMKLNHEGKTVYLLPVGKNVAFKEGPEGPRMPNDFPDGTSNTILIVEADDAHAVPWTKPGDLEVDLAHPERGLGGHFHGGFLAGLADGSVRFVSSSISKATLRAAFTPAGGEVLGPDW